MKMDFKLGIESIAVKCEPKTPRKEVRKGVLMHRLVGRAVTGVFVNSDQSLLWFDTTEGAIAYQAEGDCCSESWFADIIGADWLKGHVVRATEELPLSDYDVGDGRTRQEEDEAYGYTLATEVGVATVVFRNSSNGYYGGWLSLYEGQRPSDLTEIVSHDWRA